MSNLEVSLRGDFLCGGRRDFPRFLGGGALRNCGKKKENYKFVCYIILFKTIVNKTMVKGQGYMGFKSVVTVPTKTDPPGLYLQKG